MNFEDKNYWALILGGSSGFGLATAKKLASLGMNIFVVHRDRRGSMEKIEEEFAIVKKNRIQFQAINTDALNLEKIGHISKEVKNSMGEHGKIRLLMHSIAFGNLKLVAPQLRDSRQDPIHKLATKLQLNEEELRSAVNEIFEAGESRFSDIADPSQYNNNVFINDENMQNTIYAMGSSLLTYTQELFQKKLFANDARVIGMTSEGNEFAWRGYVAVSAAKVVLESVVRSIALEFAPHGIRANVIQAGVTDTAALRLIPGSQHLRATAVKRNPFKRLTQPEDIANVIAILASNEAAWINGAIIRADGGEHISGI